MKALQNLKSFAVQCVLFAFFVTPICYAVLVSMELSSWNTLPALAIVVWTFVTTLLYNVHHKYVFAKDSTVLCVINLVALISLFVSVVLIPFAAYTFIIESGKGLTTITAIMSVCFFLYRMRKSWIIENE